MGRRAARQQDSGGAAGARHLVDLPEGVIGLRQVDEMALRPRRERSISGAHHPPEPSARWHQDDTNQQLRRHRAARLDRRDPVVSALTP